MIHASNPHAGVPSRDSANLDILRAVAVLMVLFDHSAKYLGYEHIGGVDMNRLGYLGVLFFFVHTSLVLMRSLERMDGGGLPAARLAVSFLVRRAFRIYPLAIVAIGAVIVLGIPAMRIAEAFRAERAPLEPGMILANALLVQDLTGHGNVIGVLWSLPLELRMYLALPVLYMLWTRTRSLRLFGALWAGSAAYLGFSLPGADALEVNPYVPCFLPGVLAYVRGSRVKPRLPSVLWLPLLAALAALFLLAPTRPSWPLWITCLALGLAIPHVRDEARPWLTRPAREIATYSYGVYLLHVPLLALIVGGGGAFIPLRVTLYLAALAALSVAAFRWIEAPGQRAGARVARWLESAEVTIPALTESRRA